MKFPLRDVPIGSVLHLEGEEDAGLLDLAEASAEPAGPLRYNLDVTFSGEEIHAVGRLEVPVRMRCVVSLEPFIENIVVENFEVFKEPGSGEWVDLTPEAREDIHLSLPAHPRGPNARDGGRPEHRMENDSESRAGPNPWSALDQLKNE